MRCASLKIADIWRFKSFDAQSRFSLWQIIADKLSHPFGEHKWTGKYINPFKPKVIGDFKVFCIVALREMDKEGDRSGSRALSKGMTGISESAINKNLRFVFSTDILCHFPLNKLQFCQ